MFRPGARYAVPDVGEAVIEVRPAGRLRLPSGQLIAADPGWLDGGVEPFTATVAPGTYRVDLAVARLPGQPPDIRVAAARLTVSGADVTGWELALRPGQDPRTLGDEAFFGFDVDSGMACFADAAAVAALAQIITAHPDALSRSDPAAAVEITGPGSGANLIAFASGWGDGSYPTWIGRGPGGTIACVIADMLVLHNLPHRP